MCLALNTGGYFDATAETFIVGPLQSHVAKHGHAMTTQQAAESGQLLCVHGTQDPCVDENVAFALGRNNGQENVIAHTLRSEGHDASEDGTGRGVPLVATTLRSRQSSPGVPMPWRGGEDDQNLIVFDERNVTSPANRQACGSGNPTPTMHEKPMAIAYNVHSQNSCAMKGNGDSLAALETETSRALDSAGLTASQGGTVVAFQESQSGFRERETHATLDSNNSNNGSRRHQGVMAKSGVRRLAPTECCRLQGFSDDWLDGLSDSAKYRLLGNAVSVPVAEWIGKRLEAIA